MRGRCGTSSTRSAPCSPVYRAPGPGVFLSTNPDTTPLALRANVEHNHVVHQTVVIITIETLKVPYVALAERLTIDELGYRDDGITRITVRFGFLDRQHIPSVLAQAAQHRLERRLDAERASYFLSRIAIVRTDTPTMRPWRKRLFIAMWRNEADPIEGLGLPDERTVSMGSLIEL